MRRMPSGSAAKGKQMNNTMLRLIGGAAVLTSVLLLGWGAAIPAAANPTFVRLVNPGICAAAGGDPFLDGCAVNQFGLEYQPASGNSQLAQAAQRLGNGDGVIQPEDFDAVAEFTGGQLHQEDGTAATTLSRMAVIAFVKDDSPVTFRTTAGFFSESGISVWVCDGNLINPNPDSDCTDLGTPGSSPKQFQDDGVVVAYLSCTLATCPNRGTFALTVEQGGIVFPASVIVVGEPRHVTFFTLETAIQAGVPVVGALDADSAALACPFAANLPFIQKALGEAEKTVIVARTQDDDGTDVSGAWINWSVDDPHHNTTKSFNSQAILAQPVTPTLNLGGFGYGAPNILCANGDAVAGTVTVTARLIRRYAGQPFDPFAAPGVHAGDLDSSELTYADVTFKVGAIPSKVALTADPVAVACDGTATSTVSAAVIDADGSPAIGGTAVKFDVQALGTANPIAAMTDDKGVATSKIVPLSSEFRGVTVTVFVSAGGVVQPGITSAIVVGCNGGVASSAPGGGAAAAGSAPAAGPVGAIRGPDTGTGDATTSPGAAGAGLLWMLIVSLGAVGLAATAGSVIVRRR